MDSSHVALVSMLLKSDVFSPYRCDRNVALGINLTSLTKVLKAASNEDILTLKADDSPDVVNMVFESADQDRISEYDLKLMDIDQEHLGIPDTDYAATIKMPSGEFARICRDLMAVSESGRSYEARWLSTSHRILTRATVQIEATKEGVRFQCQGDIGNGSVTLRNHTNVDKPEQDVKIDQPEPVVLTFSLKSLASFCKASGLSQSVKVAMDNEVPLLVEYELASNSYLRFYLAPKVSSRQDPNLFWLTVYYRLGMMSRLRMVQHDDWVLYGAATIEPMTLSARSSCP